MPQTSKPMKLSFVFLWGFIASLVIVGCLFWGFMAYEVADPWPFNSATRLSQDKLFEVLRNAVTTAAALGVGITLFFSYRRQQTAEKSQELAVEAQLTAANAQQVAADALHLSTQQHELDQNRRLDALAADLRTRYSKAAEQLASDQLAIKIAGVYSLAALADDWAEHGDLDQRQVCIDLLCSTFRSLQSLQDPRDIRELERITFNAIQDRLTAKTPDRKFWGECKIKIDTNELTPDLRGLIVQEAGIVTISRSEDHNRPASTLRRIELNGGLLGLISEGGRAHSITISDSWLARGSLIISSNERPSKGEEASYAASAIIFHRVTFGNARIFIQGYNAKVIFQDCVFRHGAKLDIRTITRPTDKYGSVTFRDCHFETELFRSQHLGPDAKVLTGKIEVDDDCTYADGIQEIRIEGQRPTTTGAPG
ncbi:hypothetical protein ABIE18_004443 [Arthrobacter sp. 2762]